MVINLGTGETIVCLPTTGGLWVAGGSSSTPTGNWILPVAAQYDVNRPDGDFGPRSVAGGSSDHLGVDFNGAGMQNAPIYAVSNGTVNRINVIAGYGNSVGITHTDGSDTFYAHMIATPLVVVGETVTVGKIIGNVGNTGQSLGDHLHFETRDTVNGSPVDPEPFMLARGVTIPVDTV